MNVEFVAGFAVISDDPGASARLYEETLGIRLEGEGGYQSTSHLDGAKHFGIWPLSMAAQSCFGTEDWPENLPIPQATIEFEVADVAAGASELRGAGYELVHEARTEPWGQTVARLLSPEGVLVGLTYTPWLRNDADIGM